MIYVYVSHAVGSGIYGPYENEKDAIALVRSKSSPLYYKFIKGEEIKLSL